MNTSKKLIIFTQLTKLGLKSIKHLTNSLPFYPSKGDLLNGA
ncbi:hypothetical protein PMIT1327_02002 [Prochlorococcus marinus str. MIT 1327]|nr:hypothetical protein PMIT1312_01675 [Prochlorococcus marinus str. MIT 1312]KZR78802.1 hypothetical protein PMIT1327_02002 [Prochlorococcus marinus str. MIT 1327]